MAESSVTRGVLADSLRALLLEKPLNSVTVGDICQKAGMNRKSFYYHFRDKFDLVNWIFLSGYTERMLAADQPDVLLTMCAYLAEDRQFWRAAVKPEGQNSFQEYLGEVLQPVMQDYVSGQLSKMTLPQEQAFWVGQLTDIWQHAIIRWIKGGFNTSPEEFTGLMYRTGELLSGMKE